MSDDVWNKYGKMVKYVSKLSKLMQNVEKAAGCKWLQMTQTFCQKLKICDI